jgi:hypothetical protein
MPARLYYAVPGEEFQELDMRNNYELWANPWTYFIIAGLFVWLIPLWHSLRSGSVLATIEVLLLLAIGVGLPVLVLTFAAGLGEFAGLFGTLGAIQAVAGSSLLWFAALLIGLASDIRGQFRRSERSKGYSPAMPDYPRNR